MMRNGPENSVSDAASLSGLPLRKDTAYLYSPETHQFVPAREVTRSGDTDACQLSESAALSGAKVKQQANQPTVATNFEIPDGMQIAIPQRLLELVIREVGEPRFDQRDVRNAIQLQHLADQFGAIGFWDRQPILFSQFSKVCPEPTSPNLDSSFSAAVSKADQIAMRRAEDSIAEIKRLTKAFIGWLITNPVFREEQSRIIQVVRESGRQRIPTSVECNPRHPAYDECLAACAEFYHLWCLQGLSAPGFPVPLGTSTVQNQMQWPAYLPAYGSGLATTLVQLANGHYPEMQLKISGWLELVSRECPSQNQIPRYIRLVELHTYWRALHVAFPGTFARAKTRLVLAFAEFFHVDESTVKRDLDVISKRLQTCRWFEQVS